MATIRKKGPYQWHVQVRKKGYPTQTRTFSTRADAERWGRETEIAIERGLFFDRTVAERTTISELIDRYREEILPMKRGKHFASALRQLDEAFGKYALASLTSEMIARHRDTRLNTIKRPGSKETISQSTVKKEINLLSSLIDLAGKEWGIPVASNPCSMVKRPTEPKGRERRLENGEEERLLAAAAESSPELEIIIRFALETAARLGELLKLRWKHVNLQNRTAKLLDTKNGEDRTIPLSSAAVTALKSIPSRHISGRVFPNWAAADSFNKTWSRACQRAGIEDLRFHDLRHEATSRMADKLEMHELMKITGHKTAVILARYYHPRAEDLAKKLG